MGSEERKLSANHHGYILKLILGEVLVVSHYRQKVLTQLCHLLESLHLQSFVELTVDCNVFIESFYLLGVEVFEDT